MQWELLMLLMLLMSKTSFYICERTGRVFSWNATFNFSQSKYSFCPGKWSFLFTHLSYWLYHLISELIPVPNAPAWLLYLSNQALALVIIYLAYVVVIAMSFQGRLGCSYFCKKCYFNNVNFVLNDCASIKSHIVINPLPCSQGCQYGAFKSHSYFFLTLLKCGLLFGFKEFGFFLRQSLKQFS